MNEQTDDNQTAHGYTLHPGEQFVELVRHPKREFQKEPSAYAQMMRLTGADSPDHIGKNGPSVASLAFEVSAMTSVAPGTSPLDETDTNSAPHFPAPQHLRLYEVLFGRDALQAAIDLISSHPELARATTLKLAELQGIETVHDRQEDPGRIVHEARDPNDPIAIELSERMGWGWPYYGSVDATPLFVRTVAAYCKATEENGAFLTETYLDLGDTERDMGYAVDMAVGWILRQLDKNPEGLLEFRHIPPADAESNEWISGWNQVWKDSWDAYHHADGSIANHEHGIASIEVQVTTYEALRDAADLFEDTLNQPDKAELFRDKAAKLKVAINEYFWTDAKGGYYILGTDRDNDSNIRQLRIRTSNMGHVINSRLLEDETEASDYKFEAVLGQLLSPDMLNISGIRTLAKGEARFRPGAYHNGSVWPWDTHHIAKGIRRRKNRIVNIPYTTIDGEQHESISCNDIADDLDKRLLNVVDTVKMFPEYVRGDDTSTPSLNTSTIILKDIIHDYEYKVEQPPQEVQAWTVAVILAIKRRIDRRARERTAALSNQ